MTIDEILNYKLNKMVSNDIFNTITEQDKQYILAQAETKIKNYCHISKIPSDAYYIWADMAIELLKNIDSSIFAKADADDLMNRVTGVHVGDTSLSFSKSNNEEALNNNLDGDEILSVFSKQLQVFRKIPSMGTGCDSYGL